LAIVSRAGIGRGEVLVRTKTQAIFLLLRGLGQDRDFGVHRGGELDGHMPEPAKADDGDLLAGACAPVAQW
jgi:hypothetical protein